MVCGTCAEGEEVRLLLEGGAIVDIGDHFSSYTKSVYFKKCPICLSLMGLLEQMHSNRCNVSVYDYVSVYDIVNSK